MRPNGASPPPAPAWPPVKPIVFRRVKDSSFTARWAPPGSMMPIFIFAVPKCWAWSGAAVAYGRSASSSSWSRPMSEAMMDFNDSPEQANYRMQCRSWLAEALTDFDGRRPHFPDFDVPEVMAAARAWQSRKALAGYAAVSSPRGYGGGGGSRIEQEIFDQEERASPAPFTDVFDIGLGMALPTMAAFATPEQKSALLPPLIAGRDIWCQLFSEPSCGSDLAAVRTRAIRDGTDWILDGQKIWTSYAQHADYGLILTRSNPDVPKHKGLTCFFI